MGSNLVGGDWNMFYFSIYEGNGIIIPIDELILFRGVGIPPTRIIIELRYLGV